MKKLNALGVNDIADFQNMEDEDREKILAKFSPEQVEEIANATNSYPTINISHAVGNAKHLAEGEKVVVTISLEREGDDITDFVVAPYYPKQKEELWWLVIADMKKNVLHSIRKLGFKQKAEVVLEFDAPAQGTHDLKLFLICDSYIGCDQ